MNARLSTGVAGLDELLGGGLIPGTMAVVVGATGIGKTQLGLQFAHAGRGQEACDGVIFDMTSRGDSQSHADYAQRMFGWRLAQAAGEKPDLQAFFSKPDRDGDYLHVFQRHGRRVTRGDVDDDQWRLWQSEVANKLQASIGFFYSAFIRGARRAVIDGLEPTDRPSDSIQLQLFDYIYHQILRKDPAWVARDLFRQDYRRNADAVAAHPYDPEQICCLTLYTSHEAMLDDLISRPWTKAIYWPTPTP